ncbi:hypothetical protein RN001_002327 [Aquatica leii]|uniref:Cytochrome b5 heme-binding domain-containing protein n=1 Tax=Aquatica leii TaxID=1421715 RepID=A0AAN7PPQ7_9COLE|nr:hypothetical protein RN001_002327 [Aquatica leii]
MSTAVYYSIEEVSKNNGKNGSQIWIIINNCVYNVTEYLANNKHPGGTDLIEEYAGRNATKAFNEIGHSADAKNLLKTFKIGELVQNEVPEELKKSHTIVINNKNKQNRNCLSTITCGLFH